MTTKEILPVSLGTQPRVIVWFSCGAASATAAYLAIQKYGKDRVTLVYCDTLAAEHPTNRKFLTDIEAWLDVKVTIIASSKYTDIDDVFTKTRYLSGPRGARCTVELKKVPRFEFQRPDDIHIFGYTADEAKRVTRFETNNPLITLDWILLTEGYTKSRCFDTLMDAGIDLPMMYKLGYRNNNCIGCVKASSIKYWAMIRRDFPEVFERRAKQSRDLGVRLTWLKGTRISLDEIPTTIDPDKGRLENISCGPECIGEPNPKEETT